MDDTDYCFALVTIILFIVAGLEIVPVIVVVLNKDI
jgi:hypothetical protein